MNQYFSSFKYYINKHTTQYIHNYIYTFIVYILAQSIADADFKKYHKLIIIKKKLNIVTNNFYFFWIIFGNPLFIEKIKISGNK